MASKQIQYETLRSRNSTTFNGTYQTIGTPLNNPACIIKMVNNSTVLVTVSLDGITDMDILPPNSFFLYDISSDKSHTENLFLKKGTQFYVNGAAGTGFVYLVVLFDKVFQVP